MIDLVVHVHDGRWHDKLPDLENRFRQLVEAALLAAGNPMDPAPEIAIVCVDDNEMTNLNRQFRSKEGPTNVLSFTSPGGRESDASLGDIILAFDTIGREASAQGKSFDDHAAHMVVHGCLHLLGYDHDDAKSAAEMEMLEKAVLKQFGIEDPYLMEQTTERRLKGV